MTRRSAALQLVLVLSFCHVALAQTTGTFTPTGNMTTARVGHTATVLADGTVLVAGGQTVELAPTPATPGAIVFITYSSAERYDPSTGTFQATGSMGTTRAWHTATLLPDGRVLIAGGVEVTYVETTHSATYAIRSTAELYDPGSGRFIPTGEMTTARFGATATLLNDGRVLIASGGSAEIYDPSTGIFTATGSMNLPYVDTATLLSSGKVLVTRGNPEGPSPYVSSAELYDPATGTFAFAGYMNANHTGPTAVLLANGNVLVAGGDVGDGDGPSFVAELYDPAAGSFSLTSGLTVGREGHAATLLSDGSVLFAGGQDFPDPNPTHQITHSAEIYDPTTGVFRATGDMASARYLPSATLLRDGRVLIAGGDDKFPGTALSSAELYVPSLLIPAPVVTGLQFDQMNVVAGTSYFSNFSGSNLTPETFFDVRFTSPGSSGSAVAFNWQKGISARHDVLAGTASATWAINGVRAHQIETDHTGSFFPVNVRITVLP